MMNSWLQNFDQSEEEVTRIRYICLIGTMDCKSLVGEVIECLGCFSIMQLELHSRLALSIHQTKKILELNIFAFCCPSISFSLQADLTSLEAYRQIIWSHLI